MTPHEVASSFHRWAANRGLIQPLPSAVESECIVDAPAIAMPDQAETILRAKQITSVIFNTDANKVFVYVKRRLPKKDANILPSDINGVEVVYGSGDIENLTRPPAESQGSPYAIAQLGNDRFYTCGSSVSPGNMAAAGTMGALVIDDNGQIYGLTNNHVTGACSHSPVDLPILAPGVIDVQPGGLNPFTIGLHSRVLPMHAGNQGNVNILENSDAAIFRIADPSIISSLQGGLYDTPTELADPEEGMTVEKVGRTTGHTTGTIVGRFLYPVQVTSSHPQYGFSASIWFAHAFIIHGATDTFSQGGDSGSLIVVKDGEGNRKACGLLFAGGPDSLAAGGDRTLMLPLRPILERLNVRLLGDHNATDKPEPSSDGSDQERTPA